MEFTHWRKRREEGTELGGGCNVGFGFRPLFGRKDIDNAKPIIFLFHHNELN
jgi:hypothetical protein